MAFFSSVVTAPRGSAAFRPPEFAERNCSRILQLIGFGNATTVRFGWTVP